MKKMMFFGKGGTYMLRTNEERLVKLSVQGEISPPGYSEVGKIDSRGQVFVLPGTGGISV